MRTIEVEQWALKVIEAVIAGQPSEDERVEMKAVWLPDDQDFARRLAGHANSARGAPILWLFGVDERGRAVPGVQTRDAAAWWPQIESHFDGAAPQPLFVNVRHQNAVVVALFVETDRAPFVVKNPQFGTAGVKVAREVPWRTNTAIRTATREDLIRLLVPAVKIPILEIQELSATAPGGQRPDSKRISFQGTGYLVHLADQRLHIPDHAASGEVSSPGGAQMPIVSAKLTPKMQYERAYDRHSSANPNFIRTDEDLTALGPGHLKLDATAELVRPRVIAGRAAPTDFDDFSFTASIVLELRFAVLGSDMPIVVRARLAPEQPSGQVAAAWRWDGIRT